MRLKWVFTVKDQEKPVRFKARLVIVGFMQDENTVGATYAPTVKFGNANVLLTLALTYKLQINTIDIEGAFLNAKLKTPVYAKSIPGVNLKNKQILRVERKSMD